VRERAFYEKLGEVVRGPLGDAFLEGDALLGDSRLDLFRALAAMDPAVAPLCGALPEGLYQAEAIDSMVAFLRAHGALRPGDLDLPRKAGMEAVARRLRRALGRVRAPDPGFAVPPPYRLVATTTELQRIGRAFKNCVAAPNWSAMEHHARLLEGRGVYLTSEDPPLLAALRRIAAGVWVFEQMAGPRNAAPPEGARDALLRDLAASGLRIVAADPATAMSRLDRDVVRACERLEDVGHGEPLGDEDDARCEAA
jgi:hypothetical protein